MSTARFFVVFFYPNIYRRNFTRVKKFLHFIKKLIQSVWHLKHKGVRLRQVKERGEEMKVDTKAIKIKMVELGIKNYVDMSKRTGLDRITVSNVINGKSNPSPETIDALYKVLELTPEEAGRVFFK